MNLGRKNGPDIKWDKNERGPLLSWKDENYITTSPEFRYNFIIFPAVNFSSNVAKIHFIKILFFFNFRVKKKLFHIFTKNINQRELFSVCLG